MPRILMIDDDEDLLNLVKNFLAEKGFLITAFSSWSEAQKELHQSEPDLILLDVFIKTQDGLNICNQLRSSSFTRHIPILILSGFAELSGSATEEFGASGFLAKPFDLDILYDKITEILSHKR
ncbi:MAG: response regulator [Chitinophagaceae bacterium]|nr:response regulator [Chitinophagaceae bacterium]